MFCWAQQTSSLPRAVHTSPDWAPLSRSSVISRKPLNWQKEKEPVIGDRWILYTVCQYRALCLSVRLSAFPARCNSWWFTAAHLTKLWSRQQNSSVSQGQMMFKGSAVQIITYTPSFQSKPVVLKWFCFDWFAFSVRTCYKILGQLRTAVVVSFDNCSVSFCSCNILWI